MPFPPENSPWPLPQDAARYDRIKERSVWYAGDPDDLTAFYTGAIPTSGVTRSWINWGGKDRRSEEQASSKFWGLQPDGPVDEKMHLPIPEKIAKMSAEALFSDMPRFVVDGPTVLDPVTGRVEPREDTKATQERLDALVEMTGLEGVLLAAAETASALGSVALRLGWNPDVAPHPTIARADADTYSADYSWGVQTSTLFWRVVQADKTSVWRHLELHEGGTIYHALYMGTGVSLGKVVPLTDVPATASLKVNEFGATYSRAGLTTAVSIPNMLPDPLDRLSNMGASDFTPACIGLFSSVDQAATSLMRDVDDGQSRLLIADYMVKNAGFGKGATFNTQQRMYVPLKRDPGDSGESPIDQVQFDIRVEEHMRIVDDFSRRAIEAAGFTPDADQGEGGDMTATEYRGRNKRTLSTRDKKIIYWRTALERLLTSLLVVDREEFGTPITPMPVRVVFPDAVQEDPKTLAETAAAQKNADASSRYTRIKTMHPDWDEPQIKEEMARIEEETPDAIDPDTFGLPAAPGGIASAPEAQAEPEPAV